MATSLKRRLKRLEDVSPARFHVVAVEPEHPKYEGELARRLKAAEEQAGPNDLIVQIQRFCREAQ